MIPNKARLLIIGEVFLTFYLATAPVYWIPGIPLELTHAVKIFLIAIPAVLTWSYVLISRGEHFPIWVGVAFCSLLIAASPGWFSGSISANLSFLADLTISFGFLWVFYVFAKNGGNPWAVFLRASIGICLFSLIVVVASYFSVAVFQSPYGSRFNLANSGFGGLRTGWSNGIALYIPVLLAALIKFSHQGRRGNSILCAAGIVVIAGSQLVVGGRAGLLSTLIVVCVFLLLNFRIKALIGLFVVSILSLPVLMNETIGKSLFTSLRIPSASVNSNAELITRIDDISSGRIKTYLEGIRLITERPLQGHGPRLDGVEKVYTTSSIHNMWLKLWAEFGMFFPLVFFCIVASILLRSWSHTRRLLKLQRSKCNQYYIFMSSSLILLSGIIISLLEPSTLLGAFQNAAIWWAAAGVVLWASSYDQAPMKVSGRITG